MSIEIPQILRNDAQCGARYENIECLLTCIKFVCNTTEIAFTLKCRNGMFFEHQQSVLSWAGKTADGGCEHTVDREKI